MTKSRISADLLMSTAIILAFAANPVRAQSASDGLVKLDDSDREVAGSAVKNIAESAQAGGTTSSATYGSLVDAIQIETGGDETTANISLALTWSHPVGAPALEDDNSTRFTFATDSLGLTASAPVGKNGKPSIFDFDSFGDDTSLSVTLSRYLGSVNYVSVRASANPMVLRGKLLNRCIDATATEAIGAEAMGDPQKEAVARLVFAELRTKIDRMAVDRGAQPDFVLNQLKTKSEDEKIKALANTLFGKCVEKDKEEVTFEKLLSDYGTDREKSDNLASSNKNNRMGEPTHLRFLGAKGKIARSNYEFIVQNPLKKDDFSRTNYKIEAFGGLIFDSGRKSITGSVGYSRSYKANDEVQLCEPNGFGNQIACFDDPLGAPSRTSRYTLAGEFRWRLTLRGLPGKPSIGFAPKVSYEFNSDAALLELPIYFAPNKDKTLNGGLRMAYDTGKDDFAFGLFFGVPFSVFTD